MSEYVVSIALCVVGAGTFIHYLLMANALTKARAWVKLAIPATAGAGAGMTACGLFGETEAGLIFALTASAGMLSIALETWRCGAYVSEVMRKAVETREANERRTRQILYGIKEPVRDMADILTPAGQKEIQKRKAHQ